VNDNTYRVASEPEKTSEAPQVKPPTEVTEVPSKVEPPYSEYETKNNKPYAVDYFELGRYWNTGELYTKEIETISTYISHLVNTGEINNSTDSVSKKLKAIEKMINVKPDDRAASRVGRVAAYMEFLIKADNIKKDSAKYGMI